MMRACCCVRPSGRRAVTGKRPSPSSAGAMPNSEPSVASRAAPRPGLASLAAARGKAVVAGALTTVARAPERGLRAAGRASQPHRGCAGSGGVLSEGRRHYRLSWTKLGPPSGLLKVNHWSARSHPLVNWTRSSSETLQRIGRRSRLTPTPAPSGLLTQRAAADCRATGRWACGTLVIVALLGSRRSRPAPMAIHLRLSSSQSGPKASIPIWWVTTASNSTLLERTRAGLAAARMASGSDRRSSGRTRWQRRLTGSWRRMAAKVLGVSRRTLFRGLKAARDHDVLAQHSQYR